MKRKQKRIHDNEKYCAECGAVIKQRAVICVKCGCKVSSVEITSEGKSKNVAIILAIFFSIFTWIYTWKRDWLKFLIALFFALIFFWTFPVVQMILWLWAWILAAMRSKEWYANYWMEE